MRIVMLLVLAAASAQAQARDSLLLLRPAAVWDGVSDTPHSVSYTHLTLPTIYSV